MRTQIFAFIFCLLCLNLSAQDTLERNMIRTKPIKKLAWVIGNSNYGYGNTLKEPANDAYLIASALRYRGYKVIPSENLRLTDLRYHLKQISEIIDDYDLFVFYYAGHGFEVDGVSYIVPVDANPKKEKDIPLHCMDIDDIVLQIDLPNIPKLILIDACRENTFRDRSWKKSDEYRGEINEKEAIPKGQFDFPELLNSKVIYSTQEGEKVKDDNPFAEKLAEAIRKGGCVDEILRDVARQIIQISNRRQALDTRGLLYEEICFGTQVESSYKVSETIPTPMPNSNDDDFLPLENLQDRLGIEMVKVDGGRFQTGCFSKSDNCEPSVTPPTQIPIRDFYIGRSEVTNAQYAIFLSSEGNLMENGEKWYHIEHDSARIEVYKQVYRAKVGYENHPVVYVSWYGAKAYCEWLSQKKGGNYRLPTEAEWEFAAKGGINRDSTTYSGSNDLFDVGWYSDNAEGVGVQPVMMRQKNTLGIYDMSGNVWEWCSDENMYAPPTIVKGKKQKVSKYYMGDKHERMVKGGCWYSLYNVCTVSYKHKYHPNSRHEAVGFRVVFSPYH